MHVAQKIRMPDLPLFDSRTPERLIAGIGAGLSLGLMMEIVLFFGRGRRVGRWFFSG